MGKQAIDDDAAQVPPMVAGLLQWPQATGVSSIAVMDQKELMVEREVDYGRQRVQLNLPAVVSVDLRLNQPRLIALPNILKAKQKPLRVLPLGEFAPLEDNRFKPLGLTALLSKRQVMMMDSVEDLLTLLRQQLAF